MKLKSELAYIFFVVNRTKFRIIGHIEDVRKSPYSIALEWTTYIGKLIKTRGLKTVGHS